MFNIDTSKKVRVQVKKIVPLKPENIRLKHKRCTDNVVFGKAYDQAHQKIKIPTCDCNANNEALFEIY